MIDFSKIVIDLSKCSNNLSVDCLKKLKREFSKENNLSFLIPNTRLLTEYFKLVKKDVIKKNENIEELLRKRKIRSLSGIVPIQVLTKPYYCPWKCIFCPNDPEMPKSYIKSEPWAMRAYLNQFNPYKQVYNRLFSLTLTWHKTDKIEMIVLWWTWDVYPLKYKEEFIKWLYDACNSFSYIKEKIKYNDDYKNMEEFKSKRFNFDVDMSWIIYSSTLQEAIKKNEISKNRIIWLTIETRPEFVTDENCRFWRKLWVTRLEIWIQSMYDSVLIANKRWNTVEEWRKALHKLRQYWFKFSIHIMPWLYKSTYKKDINTFKKIFSDIYMKPDEMKIYPTSVIPNTELYNLYKLWKYKPLNTKIIEKLIKKIWLDIIPPYTRIKRLIRDIPSTEITDWSNVTNLSQLTYNSLINELKNKQIKAKKLYKKIYGKYKYLKLEKYDNITKLTENLSELVIFLEKISKYSTYIIWKKPNLDVFRKFVSLDTRSREIRHQHKKNDVVNLVVRKYYSSVWKELFISYEDAFWYLYWFIRLLLPNLENTIKNFDWIWEEYSIVRELHVYWKMQSIWKWDKDIQHKWLWKMLIYIAEYISKEMWYKKISIISWVWVREYYRKIWYLLEWTYMVKKF